MLHAKDLMIGDLVYYSHTEDGVAPYKEVICITAEDLCRDACIIETHYEPIPLTPEILEKNGFKNSEFFGELHYKDWQIMSDCYYLAARCGDGWYIDIPCKFVHELQHALRLCGIEKEIEL